MTFSDVEFLVLFAQAKFTKNYSVEWNREKNTYTVFDSNKNIVLENVPRKIAAEYLNSILQ